MVQTVARSVSCSPLSRWPALFLDGSLSVMVLGRAIQPLCRATDQTVPRFRKAPLDRVLQAESLKVCVGGKASRDQQRHRFTSRLRQMGLVRLVSPKKIVISETLL